MTGPTVEEFVIYGRVKVYLDEQAELRPYGYLSPGDSVRAEGEACVTIGGSEDSLDYRRVKYEEGYYRAATVLIEWAADRAEAAWIVYPILFVARHALELTLKKLIVEILSPVPENVGSEHNISELWRMLLNHIQEHHGYAVPRNAGRITKVVEQLTEIDPKSMSSRYAMDKNFRAMSITNPRGLSLRNLQAILNKLYDELHNILHTIEEHRERDATQQS